MGQLVIYAIELHVGVTYLPQHRHYQLGAQQLWGEVQTWSLHKVTSMKNVFSSLPRVGNYLSWVVRHTEEYPYDWTHYSV